MYLRTLLVWRVSYVHLENNKVDTLFLGEYSGIIKNGIRMDNSDNFLKLIIEGIDYETTYTHPLNQ